MKTVVTIDDSRRQISQWRKSGETIAFVPTMGNLHDGHLQLVKEAQRCADRVVVSIFVNPSQFCAGEDLAGYPRSEAQDKQKLTNINTDLLFLPAVGEIYPCSAFTAITVNKLSDMHCGKTRQGHFSGVATIVCKLFNILQPDTALFGRKDFQQLAVIRRMVEDLNIPVTIRDVATVREADGLAMSSRNGYLTNEQRKIAPLLYRTLQAAKAMLYSGETDFAGIERQQMLILQKAGFETDYFSICRADDLQYATEFVSDLVILAAAKLGKARLIDNIQASLVH